MFAVCFNLDQRDFYLDSISYFSKIYFCRNKDTEPQSLDRIKISSYLYVKEEVQFSELAENYKMLFTELWDFA
jgi:hypothetical protein